MNWLDSETIKEDFIMWFWRKVCYVFTNHSIHFWLIVGLGLWGIVSMFDLDRLARRKFIQWRHRRKR